MPTGTQSRSKNFLTERRNLTDVTETNLQNRVVNKYV